MAYGKIYADNIENSGGDTLDLTQVATTDATTSAKGYMSAADKTKLDGIAAGAEVNAVTSVNGETGAVTVSGSTDLTYTASTRLLASSTGTDVTFPEVVAAGDSGLMTGADKTKLDGIATGAEVNVDTDLSYTASTRVLASSTGTNATLPVAVADGDSGLMAGTDKAKLDGIEANATADQTGAEIKAAYEAEADTNAFTDADHTKLDGIATGAEVNAVTSVNGQTGAVTVGGGFSGDYDDLTNKPTLNEIDGEHELVHENVSTPNPNLILNGDWATGDNTNWTSSNAVAQENYGTGPYQYIATRTGGSGPDHLYQAFTTVSGTTYSVSIDTGMATGGVKIYNGNGIGGTQLASVFSTTSSDVTITTTFTATSTTSTIALQLPSEFNSYAFGNVVVADATVVTISTLKIKSVTGGDTYASFNSSGVDLNGDFTIDGSPLATVATSGDYDDLTNKPDASEQGNFSPSWSSGFSSTSYQYFNGYYSKVGKMVYFSLYIKFNSSQSTSDSNGNALKIGGLPFTSLNNFEYIAVCQIGKNNYGGNFDNISANIEPGTSEIVFYDDDSTVSSTNFSHGGKFIVVSGTYIAA